MKTTTSKGKVMPDYVYCLNASTIKPTPLEEKIRVAACAGFEAIELWSDELDAYVAGGGSLRDVRQRLGDAGLKVPTVVAVMGWMETSGREHDHALDEARRRMEQAAAIGCNRIVATPPIEVSDISLGGARYRELLELGEQTGVWPAMEYLGFVPSVYTIEQAWSIAVAADHPEATVVMDPFHILRGGGSVDDIAPVPGHRVAIWHWNDVPSEPPVHEQTDNDRVMPGDGVGPLQRMEELVRASGYRGFISLELFNPSIWERDADDVAREGIEKMRRFFA